MFERIFRPSNLTESLLPILLCNWIFGNQLIQYPNRNFIFLQKFPYFIFIICVYTVSWSFSLVYFLSETIVTYQENLYWIVTGVSLLIFCINIILGLLFKKKSLMIYDRSLKVDKKLEDLGVAVNCQKTFSYSFIVTIIFIITALLLNLMSVLWSVSSDDAVADTFAIFALNHPIHMNYLFSLTYCVLIRHMCLRFRKINKALGKFITLQSNDSILIENNESITENRIVLSQTSTRLNHNLRILKNIHLELTSLCEKITHIFGVQLIMTIVSSFVLITSLSYDLYLTARNPKVINSDKIYESFILSSWMIVNVINFQFINYIAAKTVHEWSQTGRIIHNLKSKSEDTDLCLTIQKFSLQMLQNPLKFSPCGFIDLGFPFMRDFFGTITTYLIILIQMAPN
ncbi:GSCOCT00013837001.3-RA-CDS, partial [Cotesia congregata]